MKGTPANGRTFAATQLLPEFAAQIRNAGPETGVCFALWRDRHKSPPSRGHALEAVGLELVENLVDPEAFEAAEGFVEAFE